MSPTSSANSMDGGGQASSFPAFYVILGGAALLSTVVFPVAFVLALRHHRRRSLATGQQHPGALGVVDRGNLQQEKPKLFDVYVKPGLDVREPRFEYILPMAVRTSEPHPPLATNAFSTPPNALRKHYTLHSLEGDDDNAEAPVPDDAFQTYDLAVLITMPYAHVVDPWDGLGEYTIGTTKLVVAVPSDDP